MVAAESSCRSSDLAVRDEASSLSCRSALPVTPSFFQSSNRHLTCAADPDDRENPRLEFFHERPARRPGHAGGEPSFGSVCGCVGVQNVIVDGPLGYTDPTVSQSG
jgi:hypothetical protein